MRRSTASGAVLALVAHIALGCGGNGEAGTSDAGSCVWYLDEDGDGYGDDSDTLVASCNPQVGRAMRGGDCDDGVVTNSPGARELCDGIDNDCDDETDEGFTVGASCDGTGACGTGSVECLNMNAAGCSTDFGGSESMVSPESCDAVDNDCDGDTDEDVPVGNPCPAVGECSAGVTQCSVLGAIVCSTGVGGTASQAANEACDGLDNDCDGSTDEDFAAGSACDGMGACGIGTRECVSATTTICSTEAGGSQSQAAANDLLCNGADDDCDGQTDEDRGVGQPCDDACGTGVTECATINTTRCSTEGTC